MEAENYLASGFATRSGITSKSVGWQPLSEIARTWQPSRLKGIQVSPDFGTPFLAATQVFDVRPVPRKWLSLERTEDNAERYVSEGTILVTCSGNVGRATLADGSVARTLISHDLLRIEPKDKVLWGWIYAYLRAPTVRAMMTSAQYGHMIKHLEVGHLDALPVVVPTDRDLVEACGIAAEEIIAHRNAAMRSVAEAEAAFGMLLGSNSAATRNEGEQGFSQLASRTLFDGRRRFDAFHYNPHRQAIDAQLRAFAPRMQSLREVGCTIWLPNRFKRVPAEDGVDLVDSSSIFEINPDFARRISAEVISDRNRGFVKDGWLLMSRSGQVYGLLGSVAMATSAYNGKVVTDDIIRLDAGDNIDPGYLHLTLSHEILGRPRVKSLAYGSSIPHIEVEDLLDLEIPRLGEGTEKELGELVKSAYRSWSEADRLERHIGSLAESAISSFI